MTRFRRILILLLIVLAVPLIASASTLVNMNTGDDINYQCPVGNNAVGNQIDSRTINIQCLAAAPTATSTSTVTPSPTATAIPPTATPAGPAFNAKMQLDYVQTGDLWGVVEAQPTNVWSPFLTPKNFNTELTGSLLQVSVRQGGHVYSLAGNNGHIVVAFRVNVDNGAKLGPLCSVTMSGDWMNADPLNYLDFCSGGVVTFSGLAPGPHTVRTDFWAVYGFTQFWLRPTSQPNTEFFQMQALEIRS